MKIIGVIQARFGSQRLPGKVLAPLIYSESILTTLIKRVAATNIEWWVATTSKSEDDLIASWAEHLGLKVYRGSEEDVLSRFTSVARISGADWIVRVTADDPFMFKEEINILVTMAGQSRDTTALISDNPSKRVYPLGFCPEIVRVEALFEAEIRIPNDEKYHRSHVTSFLRPYSEFISLQEEFHHPELRWTVDTKEDLEYAQQMFSKLRKPFDQANYLDFLEICESNPSLVEINKNINQKKLSDG